MRLQRMMAVAFAAALVGLVWWGAMQLVRMQSAENKARNAAIARDTLAAAADTSRQIYMNVAVLGDSLRLVERRAIQVAQRADALDRALARERVLRDWLQVTIAGLRASSEERVASGEKTLRASDEEGSGGAGDSDSVRTARFSVRQAPYTLQADVALPRAPERGRLSVEVRLDTLALELRVGCGAAGPEGVRPASVNVVAPAWASVRLGRVEQAPEVCSPRSREATGGRWASVRRLVERVGVSVGYVAARVPDGRVVAGVGVGLGVRIWP